MTWSPRLWLFLAAISGFLSVAFGAFAAHGITDPYAKDLMRLGGSYQAIHALAVFACGAVAALGVRTRIAPAMFLIGTVFFSGSLYAMALGGPGWLGAITPIGGTCFLVGWGFLACACWKIGKAAD
ncbi:MAG: hypothetical protein JWM33_1476 [Caulobacteraceae bacterium]|nr:hypothetical protein [Caulobacteraceae bacterium]